MVDVYTSKDGLISQSDYNFSYNDSVWINVVNPSNEEVRDLVTELGIEAEAIAASLDLEERSRIDDFEDQILIIVNASIKKNSKYDKSVYETIPVGIIVKDNVVITVCQSQLEVFNRIINNTRLKLDISNTTRFVTRIIYQIASSYLRALRMIDVRTEQIENLLYKETRKEYLLELLNMEKTLVYFNTALNGNEVVVKRLFRTNFLTTNDDDKDLLEDTIIEIQQAGEMAMVNSRIINSIRGAFESINNNSLNIVMKILASITIVINIPMLITSFFGMNVKFPDFVSSSLIFMYVLTLFMGLLTFIIYKIMKKKDML